MPTPYSKAADFFGRAFLEQGIAADEQEAADRETTVPAVSDLRLQTPTVGAVPASLRALNKDSQDSDAFMENMKESLLDEARDRKRPTNGHMQLRASGGVNTAVSW